MHLLCNALDCSSTRVGGSLLLSIVVYILSCRVYMVARARQSWLPAPDPLGPSATRLSCLPV